ncbi:MAG: PilZ domain-containing protein [Burkholderiaceae bacterium]|nr:PilZ domain-containing protein [Burkholderiaceae bacterium]
MTDKTTEDLAEDKRHVDRKELLTQAIFVSAHLRLKSAVTIDISNRGMSLTVPEPIAVGESCALSFDVPDHGSKQRTLVRGHIAWCVPDGEHFRVGIKHLESDPISQHLIEAAVDHYLKKA